MIPPYSIEQFMDTLTIYREESAKLDLHENWTEVKLMHVRDDPEPSTLHFAPDITEFVSLETR